MAEEVKKEEEEVKQPATDFSEQMAQMAQQIAELKGEMESVKSERDNYKTELSVLEENLAKELDKLNQPKEESKETPEPKEEIQTGLDGKKVYDNLMEVREKQKQELEKNRETEKEKREREALIEENRRLKFQSGVATLIEKEPYLKMYIEEGIKENSFKSLEDIEKTLSPTVRKALEFDYKKAEEYRNSGRDPMERYSQIEEATDTEIKKQRRKKYEQEWAKVLGA
jgi:hypothetical protein